MFGQLDVETAHNESDDGLSNQTKDHSVFGPERVDDKCADNGSGEVESAV